MHVLSPTTFPIITGASNEEKPMQFIRLQKKKLVNVCVKRLESERQ